MGLTLLAAPAEEPVSLAEAKLFARIDGADEDVLVQALVVSARLHVEAVTRRILVTQGWRWTADRVPASGVLRLPLSPVQVVSAVRLRGAGGAASPVDLSGLAIDLASAPARIAGLRSGGQAIAGIEVEFLAGYGAASAVPEPLRQATRLLVAAWYEERGGPVLGEAIPPAVAALLAPFQVRAL